MTLFATTGDDGQDALVVADAQGEDPHVVAGYEGRIAFGWSPDGRYVAYITSAEDFPLVGGPTFGVLGPLHIYDLERHQEVAISEEENVLAFFWSPDSKRLAYYVPRLVTDEQSGEDAIALNIKIAVPRSEEIYELIGFQPPADYLQMLYFFDQYQQSATIWSPDSQNVVFATVEGEQSIVAVMHASGSIEPRGIAEGTVAFWSWK
jgi:Tol biopolymer transport system component